MHPSSFSRPPNQGFKHIIFKGAFWKWGLSEVNYADPQDYYNYLSQDGIMANPKGQEELEEQPEKEHKSLERWWVDGGENP